MGVSESHLAKHTSRTRAGRSSAAFVRAPQLRRPRERTQVAAVCYRVGRKGIEFLLVQTRGRGRWTFPKGGIEPGLTRAQAAAVEAFEEAGVHGRIEEASFASYVQRKRGSRKTSDVPGAATNAYLCHVLWLGPPEESGRNPTWFSPEKTKQRLREDRSSDFADELAGVVDRAVARIRRLRSREGAPPDPLQKVQFEALPGTNDYGRVRDAFLRHIGHAPDDIQRPAAIELAVHAHLSRVMRLAPARSIKLLPNRTS